MIVNFVNRCLEGLDALLGIVGARSRVDTLDLGAPVLVIEAGRMAMAAQGFPVFVSITLDTAGAGVTVYGASTVAGLLSTDALFNDNARARGLELPEVEFWFMGIYSTASAATAANLSSVFAGIEARNLNTSPFVLGRWDSSGVDLVNGGRVVLAEANATQFRWEPFFQLPHKVDPNRDRLLARATDDAGGVLSVDVVYVLWCCPRGTFPPTA